jgi:hypothetical protein
MRCRSVVSQNNGILSQQGRGSVNPRIVYTSAFVILLFVLRHYKSQKLWLQNADDRTPVSRSDSCVLFQPVAQRPAIVLEARRPVATAPDESAWETAQLQGESAGRALQETAESCIQLPGASARLQSYPVSHACVSAIVWFRSFSFRSAGSSVRIGVTDVSDWNVFVTFEIVQFWTFAHSFVFKKIEVGGQDPSPSWDKWVVRGIEMGRLK